MEIKEKIDTRDLILDHLKKNERNMKWLSRQTSIPYGTVYSIFKHRIMNLSEQNLTKINKALNTDFTLSK